MSAAPQTTPRGTPPAPRRRRFAEPLWLVLLGVAAGLLGTWLHHPRFGVYLIALSIAGAALARLLLPPRYAGLLVVRSRALDVALLGVLAVGLFVLATVTHFPAPGG